MAVISLAGVDDALMRDVKIKAALAGQNQRQYILNAIRTALDSGETRISNSVATTLTKRSARAIAADVAGVLIASDVPDHDPDMCQVQRCKLCAKAVQK